MGKSEKKLLAFAASFMVAWGVLFYMMVCPLYAARDTALGTAKQNIEKLQKLTKGSSDTWKVPEANASMDAEALALKDMLAELKTVQAGDLGPYKLTAAGPGDPNTYFSRLRRELIEKVQGEMSVRLSQPIADDLGFGNKAKDDPVALNLVRLFALNRFFDAAKAVVVDEVLMITYPDATVMARPEGLEIEKLIQVPVVVRLRVPETALGPLLYQLEPNPKHKLADRYFCIRAIQAAVRDDQSGVLEVSLNLGTLFSESQLAEQGITVKEEGRAVLTPFNQPFGGDSNRY